MNIIEILYVRFHTFTDHNSDNTHDYGNTIEYHDRPLAAFKVFHFVKTAASCANYMQCALQIMLCSILCYSCLLVVSIIEYYFFLRTSSHIPI